MRKLALVAIAAVATLGCVGCSSSSQGSPTPGPPDPVPVPDPVPAETYVVSGDAVDDAGQLVTGVTIDLAPTSGADDLTAVTAGPDASYELEVPAGVYYVSCTAPVGGCAIWNQGPYITISEDHVIGLSVQNATPGPEPEPTPPDDDGTTVFGRVATPDGQAVSGAYVEFRPSFGDPIQTLTDENGDYTVTLTAETVYLALCGVSGSEHTDCSVASGDNSISMPEDAGELDFVFTTTG